MMSNMQIDSILQRMCHITERLTSKQAALCQGRVTLCDVLRLGNGLRTICLEPPRL